jgi:phage tail-like protein
MADANAQQAQTTGPVDPFRNFQFSLEIRGVVQGHFTQVSGLGVRVHPIRYREGGLGQIVRAIPGPVEYAEVTLKYGLTRSTELWTWFTQAVKGQVERRNVSISVLNTDGATEALRWNLFNAWPSAWHGAPLDAMGREIAIEELKLAFDSLERA